ncbi:MAG: hypothetical protein GX649_17770 [Chloroflexi bacterium]|nr:hypothetical protein [Chloroflexota bacterium]
MTPVLWLVLGGGVVLGGAIGCMVGFWAAADLWGALTRQAWRDLDRLEAQARFRDNLAQVAEGEE